MTEKEKIIAEYKKEIFKGREKEFLLDDSNKELCEKFDKKQINTKDVLKKTKMSKATFFRMLKKYREGKTETKMKIGIDQDWVLAKLTKKWLEYYNAIFDDNLKAEDLKGWAIKEYVKPEAKEFILKILNIPGFYRDLEVTKDSQRVLRKLQEQGHELFIVTDPFTKMSMQSKHEWLQENFPFIKKENYVFTSRKDLLDLDVLIDDGVHNCESFKGMSLLFDTPYNVEQEGFFKVKNWVHIEHVFDDNLEQVKDFYKRKEEAKNGSEKDRRNEV